MLKALSWPHPCTPAGGALAGFLNVTFPGFSWDLCPVIWFCLVFIFFRGDGWGG